MLIEARKAVRESTVDRLPCCEMHTVDQVALEEALELEAEAEHCKQQGELSSERQGSSPRNINYEFPLGTRSFQRLKNQTRPLPFSPRSRLEVFCSLLIQSLHLVLTVGSALI